MKWRSAVLFRDNRRKISASYRVVLWLALLSFFCPGCKAPVRFKLEELKELPAVHDIHRGKKMLAEMNPTPKTLECHLCHGEEGAKSKKQTPSMFVCLDCHAGKLAPQLPCIRCHLGTKKIFAGVGAAKIGEMASPMAEFDCDDCHDLEQKFTVPPDVCLDCHDKEEIKPTAQLQYEFVDKLAGVESNYRRLNNFLISTQGKDKSLINPDEFKYGEYIYKFALMDRSQGVHNNGFVMQLVSEADKSLAGMSKYYDKYMQRLVQETKSDDPKVRRKALTMLGEIGDERARNALIELLQSPKTGIRLQTVKILGNIRGEKTIEALIGALSDKAPKVRELIVTILEEIGGDNAIMAITEAINDSNLRVRRRAEKALKKLNTTTRKKHQRKDRDLLKKWYQTY